MARICVIRQGLFPMDPRVSREVAALAEAGHEVDVVCLPFGEEPTFERLGRVTVRRLPLRRRGGSVVRYLLDYVSFFALAALRTALLHLRRPYDLVQVNTMPDPLVFAALVPRLLGARVLLDLQECSPEFCSTKFGLGPDHPIVKAVAALEQASIRFAHRSITCTHQMRQAFIGRGADPERVAVVLNGADERVFRPGDASQVPPNGPFELICHGTVEERYGIDTIVRAVALLAPEIPDLRLRVIGEGSYLETLRRLVAELGVEEQVTFSGRFVPMPELVRAIADADVGVVAMKRDAFRDLTLCNKMYDYISMRKPVVMSRTRPVEEYYGDSCFQLFESGDHHGLARAVRELYADPERGRTLAERAARRNEPYRWAHQRNVYLSVIHSLVEERPSRAADGSEVPV